MRRILTKSALVLGLLCSLPTLAPAQGWQPTRPIKMICPFPAGGGTDQIARIVAQQLTTRLGQQVVVENRGGANGGLGAQEVMRAEPDGYTIGAISDSPMTVNPWMYEKLAYKPLQDFIAVARINHFPSLLVAHPSTGIKTVADLIKVAKEKPGTLNYSSGGVGNFSHLGLAVLAFKTGINIVHVPYRGDGPALTDLVAGHIPTMFGEPTPILPLLKDGKVRALGVSSASRLPIAPDVPTIAEAGVPGFDLTSWQMIVAPAGTPQEIVDKLHVEVKKVLELPEVKAEFARTARITVDYPSVDDLQRFMRSEIVRLGKVVEQAGIARSQ
jgi:tripartite-type tricarboxylate transporter receptor subunit TctC